MLIRCLAATALFVLPAAAAAQPWTIRGNVDVEVGSWEDDLGDQGLQAATIVNFVALNENWRLGISSGAVAAEADSSIADLRGSLVTPLDTVVSASWRGLRTRIGEHPLAFSVDADLSIPTGTSRLGGRRKNLVFDPLLARYDRYGDGLNASVGVLGSFGITPTLSLGLGVKHTIAGVYEPDGDEPDISVDPGDTTSGFAQLTWRSAQNVVTLGLEYANERTATRDGVGLLDRAPSIEASMITSLQISVRITATASASYTTRDRDRRLNEITGAFEEDPERRDGDLVALTGSLYYQLRPRTAIGLEGDFVSAGDSEIDDADFTYRPARKRWRAGVGVRHAISSDALLTASIRRLDYRDEGSALLEPLRATGWTLATGVSITW